MRTNSAQSASIGVFTETDECQFKLKREGRLCRIASWIRDRRGRRQLTRKEKRSRRPRRYIATECRQVRYCLGPGDAEVLSDSTHNSGSSSTFSGLAGKLTFTGVFAPTAAMVPRATFPPAKCMTSGSGMNQCSESGTTSWYKSP